MLIYPVRLCAGHFVWTIWKRQDSKLGNSGVLQLQYRDFMFLWLYDARRFLFSL